MPALGDLIADDLRFLIKKLLGIDLAPAQARTFNMFLDPELRETYTEWTRLIAEADVKLQGLEPDSELARMQTQLINLGLDKLQRMLEGESHANHP